MMTSASASRGATLDNRHEGRRKDDAVRERRRAAAQTHAAAQSIVQANLAKTSEPMPATAARAAAGYAAARPVETAHQIRHAAFMRDADANQRSAHQAWVFERRRGANPRSLDAEDAVIL